MFCNFRLKDRKSADSDPAMSESELGNVSSQEEDELAEVTFKWDGSSLATLKVLTVNPNFQNPPKKPTYQKLTANVFKSAEVARKMVNWDLVFFSRGKEDNRSTRWKGETEPLTISF